MSSNEFLVKFRELKATGNPFVLLVTPEQVSVLREHLSTGVWYGGVSAADKDDPQEIARFDAISIRLKKPLPAPVTLDLTV